jgi:hypothetical protein
MFVFPPFPSELMTAFIASAMRAYTSPLAQWSDIALASVIAISLLTTEL